jgi:hypothetical protein
MLEKCSGGTAELRDLVVVGARFLHQFKGLWLEHFERLNVDVAVSDQVSRWSVVCGRWQSINSVRWRPEGRPVW